jgi:hypothetical protein
MFLVKTKCEAQKTFFKNFNKSYKTCSIQIFLMSAGFLFWNGVLLMGSAGKKI